MDNKEYFLKDLVKDTANSTGFRQADIEKVLRTAFDIVGDKVAIEGNKVYLIDFFNFTPKDYAEKQGKHPQTGEPMVIDPYRVVFCSPTKSMKRKLKSTYGKE